MAVRTRLISTLSSSDMSTPANPPPQVRLISLMSHILGFSHRWHTGHLIYKCGGIDKRTIEKFEKVCTISGYYCFSLCCMAARHWWGRREYSRPLAATLSEGPLSLPLSPPLTHILHRPATHFPRPQNDWNMTNSRYRKPLNSARVPSNMPGYLTSSRLSVSVALLLTSRFGNSRLPSTKSLSSMPQVTVTSSRT
jgi:hypothetical protein